MKPKIVTLLKHVDCCNIVDSAHCCSGLMSNQSSVEPEQYQVCRVWHVSNIESEQYRFQPLLKSRRTEFVNIFESPTKIESLDYSSIKCFMFFLKKKNTHKLTCVCRGPWRASREGLVVECVLVKLKTGARGRLARRS